MANVFLSLWLDGARAWMGTAYGLSAPELLREQMRIGQEIGEQVLRFWSGVCMLPGPDARQSVGERMAMLSLRVVEGGLRQHSGSVAPRSGGSSFRVSP